MNSITSCNRRIDMIVVQMGDLNAKGRQQQYQEIGVKDKQGVLRTET